eukprot:TRINITY_DN5399_c1_g1_i1.p1 TRINITY_DN5399_c1_g1~~TRINITY_DN5399_c1_g1_i1.p1  ORF type:complete len:345 (-),score=62.86 TRINITY_DN5399_c1_g1_i1:52-1086(-)
MDPSGFSVEGWVSIVVNFLGMLAILAVFVVYSLDYYYWDSRDNHQQHQHQHQQHKKRLKLERYDYESFCQYFSRWIRFQVKEPHPRAMHVLTMINFVSVFMLSVISFLQNFVTNYFHLVVISIVNSNLYAINKFIQTSFFVIRYQFFAHELHEFDAKFTMLLWIINLASFTSLLVSTLSDPPVLVIIPNSWGMISLAFFVVLDSLVNIIVLYKFINPLRQQIQLVKEAGLLSKSLKESEFHSEFGATAAQIQRNVLFKQVVRKSMIACAATISVTVLENVVYSLAFYLLPDFPTYGRSHPLVDGYEIAWTVEAVVGVYALALNYGRFFEMWSLEACRRKEGTEG